MKRSTHFLLFALTIFFSSADLQAQTKVILSGQVIDEKQKPVEFAVVSLLKADSVVLKSTITDSLGRYSFEVSESGNFSISISAVGYKKGSGKATISGDQANFDVPAIILAPDSKRLNEVTITSKKPFIERRADKLIVNVEGSAVAVGNTALEVLKKAPGVSLDKDDNISMNGKSSVLVMLDGKPTYMSNADLANMLRSMQSTQIETIELITNQLSMMLPVTEG